ncbi:unnamed protein product, partial [Medioppia subpectinata]
MNTLCRSEGFFRDPKDCVQFYRCVGDETAGGYRLYRFACPAGTVFDERISVCNWPHSAPPCDTQQQQHSQYAGARQPAPPASHQTDPYDSAQPVASGQYDSQRQPVARDRPNQYDYQPQASAGDQPVDQPYASAQVSPRDEWPADEQPVHSRVLYDDAEPAEPAQAPASRRPSRSRTTARPAAKPQAQPSEDEHGEAPTSSQSDKFPHVRPRDPSRYFSPAPQSPTDDDWGPHDSQQMPGADDKDQQELQPRHEQISQQTDEQQKGDNNGAEDQRQEDNKSASRSPPSKSATKAPKTTAPKTTAKPKAKSSKKPDQKSKAPVKSKPTPSPPKKTKTAPKKPQQRQQTTTTTATTSSPTTTALTSESDDNEDQKQTDSTATTTEPSAAETTEPDAEAVTTEPKESDTDESDTESQKISQQKDTDDDVPPPADDDCQCSPVKRLFQCRTSGSFRDPKNCHTFYKCTETDDGFTADQYDCSAGLAFDEESGKCVKESDTTACPKKSKGSGGDSKTSGPSDQIKDRPRFTPRPTSTTPKKPTTKDLTTTEATDEDQTASSIAPEDDSSTASETTTTAADEESSTKPSDETTTTAADKSDSKTSGPSDQIKDRPRFTPRPT